MDGSYFHHHLQPFCLHPTPLHPPCKLKNERINKEIKGERAKNLERYEPGGAPRRSFSV